MCTTSKHWMKIVTPLECYVFALRLNDCLVSNSFVTYFLGPRGIGFCRKEVFSMLRLFMKTHSNAVGYSVEWIFLYHITVIIKHIYSCEYFILMYVTFVIISYNVDEQCASSNPKYYSYRTVLYRNEQIRLQCVLISKNYSFWYGKWTTPMWINKTSRFLNSRSHFVSSSAVGQQPVGLTLLMF